MLQERRLPKLDFCIGAERKGWEEDTISQQRRLEEVHKHYNSASVKLGDTKKRREASEESNDEYEHTEEIFEIERSQKILAEILKSRSCTF